MGERGPGKEGKVTSFLVRNMPEELRNQVKAAAALKGMAMQDFVVQALREAVAKAKKGG